MICNIVISLLLSLPLTLGISSLPCTQNIDCPFHFVSRCNDGLCDHCQSDADCSHIDPTATCTSLESGKNFCKVFCDTNNMICDLNKEPPYCREGTSQAECDAYFGPGVATLITNNDYIDLCAICQAPTQCSSQICHHFHCVECIQDSDCGGSTPVCDKEYHYCRPCIESDCGLRYCDPSSGSCKDCLNNNHCPLSTPYCQPSLNQCIPRCSLFS